jgi:hypothetical protein
MTNPTGAFRVWPPGLKAADNPELTIENRILIYFSISIFYNKKLKIKMTELDLNSADYNRDEAHL